MVFQFKQFSVSQQYAAQKTGTDSVLLGALTNRQNAERILDIGTGTGILALMLAQKTAAYIDAIDIDSNAQKDAILNFEKSKWKNRITFELISIQDFQKKTSNKYDLIICNPPYFQNSLHSIEKSRTTARHNVSLNYNDLFKAVEHLLSDNGQCNLIVPYEFEKEILILGKTHNLFPAKRIWIKPTPQKKAHRVIVQFEKSNTYSTFETIVLETGGRHIYSDRYKELVKEYLLKF